MELVVRQSQVGAVTVVHVSGEADLATLPKLADALTRATADAAGIVAVDLDEVQVLDDAALGLLLGAAGRARQAGAELSVVCSAEPQRERLAITGFDRAVAVVSSLDQLARKSGS